MASSGHGIDQPIGGGKYGDTVSSGGSNGDEGWERGEGGGMRTWEDAGARYEKTVSGGGEGVPVRAGAHHGSEGVPVRAGAHHGPEGVPVRAGAHHGPTVGDGEASDGEWTSQRFGSNADPAAFEDSLASSRRGGGDLSISGSSGEQSLDERYQLSAVRPTIGSGGLTVLPFLPLHDMPFLGSTDQPLSARGRGFSPGNSPYII